MVPAGPTGGVRVIEPASRPTMVTGPPVIIGYRHEPDRAQPGGGAVLQRGTAEQWIKEGKQAVKMTRLSCHQFRPNEVRLWLSLIA